LLHHCAHMGVGWCCRVPFIAPNKHRPEPPARETLRFAQGDTGEVHGVTPGVMPCAAKGDSVRHLRLMPLGRNEWHLYTFASRFSLKDGEPWDDVDCVRVSIGAILHLIRWRLLCQGFLARFCPSPKKALKHCFLIYSEKSASL
jgi:hypothetical protein